MILVDTPAWIDHLHRSDRHLVELLETRSLHGQGLSLVDAHPLAATLISGSGRLWTRDRRLSRTAARLGVDASL